MLHAGGPAIVQNAAMKRHRPTAPVLCPCGLNTPYAECCGLWHAGKIAPDAEKLMRSRYVAYVMNLKDYIYSTWHPSTRPATDLDVNGDGKLSAAKFIGLTVLTHIRTTAVGAHVWLGGRRCQIFPSSVSPPEPVPRKGRADSGAHIDYGQYPPNTFARCGHPQRFK